MTRQVKRIHLRLLAPLSGALVALFSAEPLPVHALDVAHVEAADARTAPSAERSAADDTRGVVNTGGES